MTQVLRENLSLFSTRPIKKITQLIKKAYNLSKNMGFESGTESLMVRLLTDSNTFFGDSDPALL